MKLCPIRLEIAALDASPFPLDMTLIKQHCAIDSDDFDDLLDVYARAAIRWAENSMHRTIFARAHRWVLRDFPSDTTGEIRLPRGKTVSVESVVYTDASGSTTLTGPSSGSPAGTGYQEDLSDEDGGYISPPVASSWPSVNYEASSPLVINFTAGYETADVPADIMHALFFAVSDAFEMRGSADMGQGRNFDAREALLSPYRLVRWY